MTTRETPVSDAAPKKLRHPAVFVLGALVLALTILGVAFGIGSSYVDRAKSSQAASMQKSLESHGIQVDSNLAQRVSDGCRYRNDGYPLSVTIVHDYKGKKSAITLMCDGNSAISDFAAVAAG